MNFNVADLLQAMRDRLRFITAVTIAVFFLVAVVTFAQPRKYRATSSLVISLTQQEPTDDKQAPSSSEIDSIIGTQVDVINSASVINEVAHRAKLDVDPDTRKVDILTLQEAVKKLLSRLTVTSTRQSNVIQISVLDPDPEVAAQLANSFAEVYLEKQIYLRASPAKDDARWFDARTAEVRKRYETAQQRLTEFQRAHSIIGVDRMDIEADKLRNMSSELVQAQAAAAEAKSRAGSADMPEVASSDIVQNLQQQVAVQAGLVAEMAKTLGPNNPDMRAANAQLDQLESSLAGARASQVRALSTGSTAAVRREAEVKAKAASQQNDMLQMSTTQDQLMVLQRDVDAAKQTYDAVSQKLNEAELKGEISQASASLLDKAYPPALPAKPVILLWLAGGLILGVLCGTGWVGAKELLTPRIRTASGLNAGSDMELLADLSSQLSIRSLLFRRRRKFG